MSATIPNSKAKKILIDTDMSMDVDDVTAIVFGGGGKGACVTNWNFWVGKVCLQNQAAKHGGKRRGNVWGKLSTVGQH